MFDVNLCDGKLYFRYWGNSIRLLLKTSQWRAMRFFEFQVSAMASNCRDEKQRSAFLWLLGAEVFAMVSSRKDLEVKISFLYSRPKDVGSFDEGTDEYSHGVRDCR